jgi:hypothetical protein
MPVAQAGRLRAHGVELDTAEDRFGWLQEMDPRRDGAAAWRSRMAESGYLYFRNFWDREEVQTVRNSITAQLDRLGFLVPGSPPDEARGIPGREVGRAMGNPLDQRDPLLRNLVFGRRLSSFFDEFLGGPSRHFEFIWFRTKGHGLGSPIHCDLVYMGRGTHDLYTVWVPLGTVDLPLGGLLVLEGSHRKTEELKDYLARDVDEYCVNRDDAQDYVSGKKWWDGTLSRNPLAIQGSLGGRWLTSPRFELGDVVIFPMSLVHGSLDNETDRIRLSVDIRYQLASDPIDPRWVGEQPPGHANSMKLGRVC